MCLSPTERAHNFAQKLYMEKKPHSHQILMTSREKSFSAPSSTNEDENRACVKPGLKEIPGHT